MADNAVKITALPEVSSLQATDLIPVVDASGTQTVKADLQKVMDLGPGAGTVTESTIAPGAVVAGKTGFTGASKIAYASSTASVNNAGRYVGTEATISDYSAQTLFKLSSAAEWFAAMGMQPNFTGPITVPFGGIELVEIIDNSVDPPVTSTEYQIRPTYTFGTYANINGVATFAGDLTTGMYGGDEDSGEINFSSLDQRVLSLNKDRVIRVLQQTTVDADGIPQDDSATTEVLEDGVEVSNRVEQNARMLQFIGANAYAVFKPESAQQAPYDSGNSGTNVGRFLGLPASRRASTLVGTIHHGPNIRDTGHFGAWNGGLDAQGNSQYPTEAQQAAGTAPAITTQGSGNRFLMQKRVEEMGYDPNTLQILLQHAYVSWWDNALINLGANFATNPRDFSSQRASHGNRTMIKRIRVQPQVRSLNLEILKMRGFTSLEQDGSGAQAVFTAHFESDYPDTNYTVNINGYGTTAASVTSVTKYTDKVTFKTGAYQTGSQISISTMR